LSCNLGGWFTAQKSAFEWKAATTRCIFDHKLLHGFNNNIRKKDLQKKGVSVNMSLMQNKEKQKVSDAVIEKMFKAGVHYGYSKTRRHPSTSSYIYTTKNKADIINLEKTGAMLEEATEYVKGLAAKGKIILLVGTKPEAKVAVKNLADATGMPYVTERWIGGTLSNFSEIKKRILELENYHKDSAGGKLEKYTKKERVVMAKKMEKLAKYYTGLLSLKKVPDALFIVDARTENIAVKEAKGSHVPVIALTNSDTNIKEINYPILANDGAIPSIKFFTEAIGAAYREAESSSK
jgi:small subunit ribosomal protein S2